MASRSTSRSQVPLPLSVEPPTTGFKLIPKVCYALILLTGILSYGLSLNADFYMDDYMHIVDNEFVKGESWDLPDRFRAFTYLVYRAVYAVAGPSRVAFHLLNFCTHLGAACALFACGRLLLRRLNLLRSCDARAFASFAGALVFVAHPLASEAVNYARCTMIDLVTLFTILATWVALRWAERPNRRDAALFFTFMVMGMFSKEVGIFHITFHALLVAWITFDRKSIQTARDTLSGPQGGKWKLALVLAAIPTVYLGYNWASLGYSKLTSSHILDHILTQGRMIWGYFTQMVAPHGLLVDHHIAWSRSMSDTPALVGTLAMFGLFLLTVVLVVKKRTRPVAILFAMVIFPLALRLLYPIYEHFVEYRAYPTLPWFGLIVGVVLTTIAQRHWKATQWALIAIILAGVAGSVLRSAQWSRASILAHQSITKYPLNNRPRLRLQSEANLYGEYDKVLSLRNMVYENYEATLAYNNNNRWEREFDMGSAHFVLIKTDQMAAFAIAEISGSKQALKFIDQRLLLFREKLGPFDSEGDYLKTMEALINVRDILLEHGDDDRDRRYLSAADDSK